MSTVAITGAGRGIGLELVRQHLAAGDRVLALVRHPAGATELQALAAGSGGKITVHTVDVGTDASVRAGAADSGSDPVDILYNVAGVEGPAAPELESSDWAVWDDVFNIMVHGPLRVLQAFLPRLHAGAKVINFSSQLAASTWPYGGYYAYGGAKAALNRVMRSVAIDLKDRGIVVGVIHPGWVQTDMGGPSAPLKPADSVGGMRRVIETAGPADSGVFKDYSGKVLSW